ncbi:MAG: hypothetical protein J6M91_08225 [Methanobrevibacter sp.]|nr:hypothetical protein [Methanobrevibacter sp.]
MKVAVKLNELIPEYGKINDEYNRLGKIKKEQSETIKSTMLESDTDEVSAGGYVAKVSKVTSTDFNEEALIEYLKENWTTLNRKYKIVKKQEYIDYTALENALYHDAFKDKVSELNKFREEKVTYKLTVKKEKK